MQTVLKVYGKFSSETLLRHPKLSEARFNLKVGTTNTAEIMRVLKEAFDREHIAVLADGEKFTMIVPSELVSAVKLNSPKATNGEPTVLSLCYMGMPLGQMYAEYARCQDGQYGTYDHKAPETGAERSLVFVSTPSALTRREVLYMYETLFDWHGVKMLKGENGLYRAVRKGSE